MVDPITTLSLCSGVGWLDEGVRAGCEHFGWEHRVAAYCEWEAYATAVLMERMEESSLEPAPVWCGDLGQFDGAAFRGAVDGITAGFPCQPWSAAGKQLGTDDDRWLWPAIVRLIDDVEPGFVFLENVSALIAGGGLEHVLSDLAKMGFDAEWCCLTAEAVGASHRRERVFILAYDPSSRGWGLPESTGRSADSDVDGSGGGQLDDSGCDGPCQPGEPSAERPIEPCRRGIESGGRCSDLGDSRESAGARDTGAVPATKAKRRRKRFIDGNLPVGLKFAGADVADAGRNGRKAWQRRIQRETVEPEAGTAIDPELRRPAVAVTGEHGRRVGVSQRRPNRGTVAGGAGGDLADAERDGLGECRRTATVESGERRHREIFAPGPGADWSGIPEALWPATERGVRVLVDGRAVVLDASRADQLRCSGNGVVALCAATAFVELVRRIMK